MDIKVIDFNSCNEINKYLELASAKADLIGFNQISALNSLSARKSFCKQLNDLTCYVSLKDDHFHVRLLLVDNWLLLNKNSKLDHKIEDWNLGRLIHTPYDLLCLLGFESLERIQNKIESLESAIDSLEEEVLEKPDKSQQMKIIKLHRKAIRLKKQINEDLSVFIRTKQDTPLWNDLLMSIQSELDNARQLVELMENLREAYQASVDNKSNDIMKFLTILATIFLPINILTSFFGMNFDKMPLIHSQYGMYVLYALIIVLIVITVMAFKRKKWF
ncbi:CorA family divalent cation transporter [Desulfosporosinus sp. PR]|uniref:magnesium transporter CorA family protein n=1 Tax=Candidatus Desulfosporosinus nitrosoreducens TaxID=3401928 RepID=UPI0027E5E656|nr:CorA family divalent cation transporter [Desulfosporosinus sp. PR]MDQ7093807.1 CorA family divalent cation transporter [Desulfosporosinus sp. PR]